MVLDDHTADPIEEGSMYGLTQAQKKNRKKKLRKAENKQGEPTGPQSLSLSPDHNALSQWFDGARSSHMDKTYSTNHHKSQKAIAAAEAVMGDASGPYPTEVEALEYIRDSVLDSISDMKRNLARPADKFMTRDSTGTTVDKIIEQVKAARKAKGRAVENTDVTNGTEGTDIEQMGSALNYLREQYKNVGYVEIYKEVDERCRCDIIDPIDQLIKKHQRYHPEYRRQKGHHTHHQKQMHDDKDSGPPKRNENGNRAGSAWPAIRVVPVVEGDESLPVPASKMIAGLEERLTQVKGALSDADERTASLVYMGRERVVVLFNKPVAAKYKSAVFTSVRNIISRRIEQDYNVLIEKWHPEGRLFSSNKNAVGPTNGNHSPSSNAPTCKEVLIYGKTADVQRAVVFIQSAFAEDNRHSIMLGERLIHFIINNPENSERLHDILKSVYFTVMRQGALFIVAQKKSQATECESQVRKLIDSVESEPPRVHAAEHVGHHGYDGNRERSDDLVGSIPLLCMFGKCLLFSDNPFLTKLRMHHKVRLRIKETEAAGQLQTQMNHCMVQLAQENGRSVKSAEGEVTTSAQSTIMDENNIKVVAMLKSYTDTLLTGTSQLEVYDRSGDASKGAEKFKAVSKEVNAYLETLQYKAIDCDVLRFQMCRTVAKTAQVQYIKTKYMVTAMITPKTIYLIGKSDNVEMAFSEVKATMNKMNSYTTYVYIPLGAASMFSRETMDEMSKTMDCSIRKHTDQQNKIKRGFTEDRASANNECDTTEEGKSEYGSLENIRIEGYHVQAFACKQGLFQSQDYSGPMIERRMKVQEVAVTADRTDKGEDEEKKAEEDVEMDGEKDDEDKEVDGSKMVGKLLMDDKLDDISNIGYMIYDEEMERMMSIGANRRKYRDFERSIMVHVEINGQYDKVCKAKDHLAEMCRPYTHYAYLRVNDMILRCMGSFSEGTEGSRFVQTLRGKHSVLITTDRFTSNMIICGSKANINNCLLEIQTRLDDMSEREKDYITKSIQVEQAMVRWIVGLQGSVRESLQKEFTVHITIQDSRHGRNVGPRGRLGGYNDRRNYHARDRRRDERSPREEESNNQVEDANNTTKETEISTIVLYGTPETVDACEAKIFEIIASKRDSGPRQPKKEERPARSENTYVPPNPTFRYRQKKTQNTEAKAQETTPKEAPSTAATDSTEHAFPSLAR